MRKTILAVLATSTSLLAAPAFADPEIAAGADISGVTSINERISDVKDAVQDDFDRSYDGYRHASRRTDGLSGGVSLSYAGREGNNEGQNFDLGARVSQTRGKFTQNVGVLLSYGEDDEGAYRKEAHVIYDAVYDFSPRAYVFGLGRVSSDGMVDEDIDDLMAGNLTADEIGDLDGRIRRDAFLGFGPGYRIVDRDNAAWRVQAGPGIRYTQAVDFNEPDLLNSETGAGYIVSSRFWYGVNDRFSVTNDTDYLESDINKVATNDLGLNYNFSDNLLGRASYKTEYVSDRAERTDNTFGLSVGLNF